MATRETTLFPQAFAGRVGLAFTDVVRTVGPVLFVVWFAYVIVTGRPNYDLNVYDATLRLRILFGALFLAYLAYLAFARKLPGPTPLDWCAAGLVVASVLATLWSVNPRMSAESSLLVGVCVISFFVFQERRLFSLQLLIRSIVLVTGLVGFIAFVRTATQYADWLATVDALRGVTLADLMPPPVLRSQGVLDHPNNLAMFLNIGLPFAFILALKPAYRWDRAIGMLAASLGLLALFFTLSRGAWLGTLVAQGLFWSLILFGTNWRLSLSKVREWLHRHVVEVYAGAGLAFLAAFAMGAYIVVLRPAWLFRATISTRLETARAALEMFWDHPLTGAGPNTFGLIKGAYGIERPDALNIAHNAYVQVLADIGLVGALVVLSAGIVVAWTLFRSWRHSDAAERLVIAAGAAAITATLVHGLSDSPPTWNTVLLPFSLVLAILMRLAPPTVPNLRSFAVVPRLVALGLIPVILGGWLVTNAAHSQYDQSLAALNDGENYSAALHAVEAARGDPDFYVYQLHAGISLVTLHLDEDETVAWPSALDEGISFLRRTVELDPQSSLGYANLALALQLRGDNQGAAEAAHEALAVSLADPTIAVVAGSVYEAAGLREEAVEAYAQAVSLDPSLLQSPYWIMAPERESLRAAVVLASDVDACQQGYFSALYGVYVRDLDALAARCRALVEQPGGESKRASLALILFAQGKVEDAQMEAEMAARRTPNRLETLITSAVVLSAGDIQLLRQDLFAASQHGSPDAIALLGYTYERPEAPSLGFLNLFLRPQHDEMPAVVGDRLNRVAPKGTITPAGVLQRNRMARIYFADIALRQPPSVVFIPGQWSELVAPSVLLALHAQGNK